MSARACAKILRYRWTIYPLALLSPHPDYSLVSRCSFENYPHTQDHVSQTCLRPCKQPTGLYRWSLIAMCFDSGNTQTALVKRPWNAHSRAYFLAVIGFMGIFLFGYDTGLGGGVLVLPSFARDFGITGTATEVANLQGNVVAILQVR